MDVFESDEKMDLVEPDGADAAVSEPANGLKMFIDEAEPPPATDELFNRLEKAVFVDVIGLLVRLVVDDAVVVVEFLFRLEKNPPVVAAGCLISVD